jgi:very-short-patch-repair endonuclease
MARKLRGTTFPATVITARSLRRNETEAERVLWKVLRNGKLNHLKFRRQHPIDKWILDFFCVQYQLAIEIDGEMHRNYEQIAYDFDRAQVLAEKGISMLRFKNDDVLHQGEKVVQEIMKTIHQLDPHENHNDIHPSPDDQERD